MLIELPETFIDAIAERVWLKGGPNLPSQEETDPKVLELRHKLALINEKEHISVAEAALFLNCSDGHIRNLVKRAKKIKPLCTESAEI